MTASLPWLDFKILFSANRQCVIDPDIDPAIKVVGGVVGVIRIVERVLPVGRIDIHESVCSGYTSTQEKIRGQNDINTDINS